MNSVKPFQDHDDLIRGLQKLGLAIPDPEKTKRDLKKHGYHRLSGYRYLFRQMLPEDEQDPDSRTYRSKQHLPGATFDDVVSVADFDRRLRMVIISGTEDFEIRLRTAVAHVIARKSVLGHLDPTHLDSRKCSRFPRGSKKTSHQLFLEKVKEATDIAVSKNDDFAVHHQSKYGPDLPVWAVVEHLTFGSLIFLLDYLQTEDKRSVARLFGATHPNQFIKWVRAIQAIRNDAAHGRRLFNTPLKSEIAIPPNATMSSLLDRTALHLAEGHDEPQAIRSSKRIYAYAALLSFLLRSHPSGSDWFMSFRATIDAFPVIQLPSNEHPLLSPEHNMGFPVEWRSDPLWNEDLDVTPED